MLLSSFAAYGIYLLYTAFAFGWRGARLGPGRPRRSRPSAARWLASAGLPDVEPRAFAAVTATVAAIGGVLVYVLFGALVPAIVGALSTGFLPIGSHRTRRERRRAEAREAWPRLIEEIRVLTGPGGRSIPTALFEVGARAPSELLPAFAAGEREWLLSTDFDRTVEVLKDRLADPTADATLETLLVAHSVGGSDLDRRLAALLEDRVQDLQGRKDARAKQAGVRFARRFVLVVPIGMALAGLSIGNGRAAYATAEGQLAVVVGIVATGACWVWAGRLMRLPEEDRVLG